MSELQPIIPREENQHGNPTLPHQDTPEPVPITEQEVGEYREQDRFLPVSFFPLFHFYFDDGGDVQKKIIIISFILYR